MRSSEGASRACLDRVADQHVGLSDSRFPGRLSGREKAQRLKRDSARTRAGCALAREDRLTQLTPAAGKLVLSIVLLAVARCRKPGATSGRRPSFLLQPRRSHRQDADLPRPVPPERTGPWLLQATGPPRCCRCGHPEGRLRDRRRTAIHRRRCGRLSCIRRLPVHSESN